MQFYKTHITYIKMLVAPLFRSSVHQDARAYDPQQIVTYIFKINSKLWQSSKENMLNKNGTRNSLTTKKISDSVHYFKYREITGSHPLCAEKQRSTGSSLSPEVLCIDFNSLLFSFKPIFLLFVWHLYPLKTFIDLGLSQVMNFRSQLHIQTCTMV